MRVKLSFLQAGHCVHPEKIVIQGGSWKKIKFPASVAVIEHPKEGVTLFDTGYSPRFYEITKHFPNRFYALITPVTIEPEQTAEFQLRRLGILKRDVRRVILSHFHADHVAGAADFSFSDYVYSGVGYQRLKKLSSFSAVKAGFLRGLLPNDFEHRSLALTADQLNLSPLGLPGFDRAFDLFKDESVRIVELPGHAEGHLGVVIKATDGKTYFLVADACWLSQGFKENKLPNPITKLLFSDSIKYASTMEKLHHLSRLNPELVIVPCHCTETLSTVPMLDRPQLTPVTTEQ